MGDIGNIVLRDRKHLAQDGLLIVVMTVSREQGSLLIAPEVISRGFVYVKESDEMMDEVRKFINTFVEKARSRGKSSDWASIKSDLRNDLRRFLYEKTKRSPMILPIIVEI